MWNHVDSDQGPSLLYFPMRAEGVEKGAKGHDVRSREEVRGVYGLVIDIMSGRSRELLAEYETRHEDSMLDI